MQTRVLTLASVVMVLLSVALAAGQTQTRRFYNSEGPMDGFNVPGLGAVLMEQNGTISVIMLSPAQERPEEFREVDLQENDIIVMCNGKRIKTLAALREILETTAVGDAIKLAVKRGSDRLIVSFPNPDPEKYADTRQMVMMTTTVDADGGSRIATSDGQGATAITLEQGQDMAVVLEAGLILADSDSGLFVMQILPGASTSTGDPEIETGFLVTAINNVPISDVAGFHETYDAITTGQKFALAFDHGDETTTGMWIKRDAPVGRAVRIKQ